MNSSATVLTQRSMIAVIATSLSLAILNQPAPAATPAIGEWDGVTPSAHLQGPYENPIKAHVPFGIISYYNHPWRSYMDTWPASQWKQFPGANWNIDHKYAEPMAEVLEESGFRSVRVEIGWGNIGWDDDLPANTKADLDRFLAILKKHGIRPQILLNAHHGVPCPMRDVPVELTQDAHKGDLVLHLKSTAGI
nr:hypothetical protein [Armatimonadota bacterium]